jgi:chitinase
MNKWKVVAATLAVIVLGTVTVLAAPVSKERKVVAYLAAWENWSAKDITAEKLTNINLSFARIQEGVIANVKIDGKSIEDSQFAELEKAKQVNPNLKVSIAVGGWGGDGFSDAALTAESREKFADSVVTYIQKYNLDGIDIDWEYPVQGGWGAIKSRAEDKENFTLFMVTLREKLDQLGADENKHYLLTYAASVQPWAIANVEFDKVVPLVDAVYLMTYDYHGAWEPQTGHLSPLYLNSKDTIGIGGTADAVKRYLAAGIPAEKLVFGTAFYGRYWQGADTKEHGLYQKASNQGGGEVQYKEITNKYTQKQGFKRYWDDSAKAAYLYNEKTGVFVTYNDPEAMKYEMEFVRDNNLGGAFIWELNQDSKGVLLDTLYQEMKK